MLLANGRDQADATAYHERGRGDLPTARASLVVAHGAEDVLQVVVGAGDLWSAVAHEQTKPVAGGHLQEVAHRRLERTYALGALAHGRQQASIGSAQRADAALGRVV